MKSLFIAAAAASVLVKSSAIAAPFPHPQSSSVVATQLAYSSVQYTVAAGSRFSFPVPVTNRPIHLMVACLTAGDYGVGSVTLVRAVSQGANVLVWAGTDLGSNDGFGANPAVPVDEGDSATKGQRILFADSGGRVDVVVNSAQSIAIANSLIKPTTVVVTMTY